MARLPSSPNSKLRTLNSEAPLKTDPPPRRRLPRFLRLAAVLIGVALLLFLFRVPLLRGAARLWVISDQPEKATAAVVLGGGRDTRPFVAARLYREGLVPRILVPRVKPTPSESLGLAKNDSEVSHEILLKEGVPDSAIEFIGRDVSSTREEVAAIAEWMKSQPGASASPPERPLLLIQDFHTRRTRWIFTRILGETATIRILAGPHRSYATDEWFQHEEGLIDFQNELIKSAFYHLRY